MAALPLVAPAADPARPYALVDDRLWFVDTGASRTTCDDDFVAALGVVAQPTLLRAYGEVGSVPLRRAVLRDVTVGGWTFRRLPCAVRDLATTSSLPDLPADPVVGILGANVFRSFVVDLDLADRALRLRRDVPAGFDDGVVLRRERVFGARLVARLVVDGAPIDVVVDTGADRTYLPLDSGDELARYAAQRQGTGPGGASPVEVVIRGVETATVGGRALPLRRYVHRRGRPGLLGMDALGVARVVVDSPRRRLAWRDGAPAPFVLPDDARRAALEADGFDAGRTALAAWELAFGDADRAVDLYARVGDAPGRMRALFVAGRWEEARVEALSLGEPYAAVVRTVENADGRVDPRVLAEVFGVSPPGGAGALRAGTGGVGASRPAFDAGIGPALLAIRAGVDADGVAAMGPAAARNAALLAALAADRETPGAAAAACAGLPPPRDADEVLVRVACGQIAVASDALAGLRPGAVRPAGMPAARARAAWLDARALLAAAAGDHAGAAEAIGLALRLAPWDAYLYQRRAEIAER